MPVFYDQLGREVLLLSAPQRIISVVPSQTELLFSLGLDEQVIGITKFCTHPADKVKTVTKVGGTKQLDIAKIKQLQPDLIIANKEENERSQIEELSGFFSVWISDIKDLPSAINMIEGVGAITGRGNQAIKLSQQIAKQFSSLTIQASNKKVAYFIWRKPYMVAGKGTFIDSMLQKCGLVNAFDTERYPEINAEMLAEANPEIIFLSSEPYPFAEKHIKEFKAIVPDATIKLVDGELFSWYGSRLLQSPAYFEKLVIEINR